MKIMKARLTFVKGLLGTSPADPEVYTNYVESKAPEAAALEEEVAALGVDEVIGSAMTVFHRDADGSHRFYTTIRLRAF